jgi:quercetin dioxygenase-like cupin family protein
MMSTQPLPPIRRLVTGHDNKGKAIVWRDNTISASQAEHGPFLTRLWSSAELPPDVNTSEDLGLVDTGLANKGTICRVVDFPPKSIGMVHRSITLDYIYVLEGEVILTLDDGSKTKVRKGEMVVQQGTMHGWDNETSEWSRLLCILIAAKSPMVSGQELKAEVPFQI